MLIKSFIGATCTCLVVISFNVFAVFVSVDWKTAGIYLITQGINNGFTSCVIPA